MNRAIFALPLAAILLIAKLYAEDSKPAEISPELRELIGKLDADLYSDRTEASEKLAKLGKDAIPGLEQAVHSESLEVSLRAFELLTKMHREGSGDTKQAATAAFQRLAKGEGSVARQSVWVSWSR